MSSYRTTVYIPDAERDTLLAEIRDTNNYIATRREQIERIRRQAEEKEKELARIRKEADGKIQAAVNSLVTDHRRFLTRLSEMTENDIVSQTNSLMDSLNDLRMQASANKIKTNQLNAELSGISRTISNTFNEMLSREADAGNRARVLSEELHSMLDRIKQLNPAAFKPAEYQRVLSLVMHVDENIAEGDYNAALTVSQNGIIDTTQLLTRLMVLNEQYSERFDYVCNHMIALNKRIRNFDSEACGVIPVNVGNETIEYDYDISFWSEGLFDVIKERFFELSSYMNQINGAVLPMDQIDRIDSEINQLDHMIDDCDRLAREEMISSASNFHTAEIADDYFNQIGYRLQTSGYKDGDDRKPYTMTYVNGNGSRLAAVVASSGNSEKPSFIVEVISDNEVEADITKRGVMSGLQSAGADITAPVISNDCDRNITADGFINRVVEENETLRQMRKPAIVKLNQ